MLPSESSILKKATINEAPKSSKTMETVVEVGKANVLKISSKIISVSITAMKMIITSANRNWSGKKTPLRATSIIPEEKVAPSIMPKLATSMMIHREATLEPIAEFRKFTASLLTPTIRSEMAKTKSITISMR